MAIFIITVFEKYNFLSSVECGRLCPVLLSIQKGWKLQTVVKET